MKPLLSPLVLKCPSLPPLPPQSAGDLEAVLALFESVPSQSLGQFWLEKEEIDFAPGFVRAGWRGNSLLVLATLVDADIFNCATGHNQKMWEMGDSFEIFLQPVGQSAYVEFQITPENKRLQLRFASHSALADLRRNGSIKPFVIDGEIFHARTWVPAGAECWYVYAEIQAVNLGDEAGPLPGRQWHYSFSRYDYTKSRKWPVISSTSPHTTPDFHRHHEWGIMSFEALLAGEKR